MSTQSRNKFYSEFFSNISLSGYLQHKRVVIKDDRCNAPYRPTADSNSCAIIDDKYFYDHSHDGNKGGVWKMALLLNGNNKKKAMKDLCEFKGIPFMNMKVQEIDTCEKWFDALKKVYDNFPVTKEKTPEVYDYIKNRNISDEVIDKYFRFVPDQQSLLQLVDEKLARETCLLYYADKMILFFNLEHDQPNYYYARLFKDGKKGFRKCPTKHIPQPLFGLDSLYTQPNVIIAEGMFDVASLLSLEYAVVSFITGSVSKAEYPNLIKALRWRCKHKPDWPKPVIMLDNDKIKEDGSCPGAEFSNKMAHTLYLENAIDIRIVKHNHGTSKVDVNDLHRQGKEAEIRSMIENAQLLSELYTAETDTGLAMLLKALNSSCYPDALKILQKTSENNKLPVDKLIKMLDTSQPYQNFYKPNVEMYLSDGTVTVFLNHTERKEPITIAKANLVDNFKGYQLNPKLILTYKMIDIPAGTPTWRVTRNTNRYNPQTMEYNLFTPTEFMLISKTEEKVAIPKQFDIILSNIAGAEERKWLINHMATYFQKLIKLPTFALFVGPPGTAKNTTGDYYGRLFGGAVFITKEKMQGNFNEYLKNPVIFVDELNSTHHTSNDFKNAIKALNNEEQYIDEKYTKKVTCSLNNYIMFATNERGNRVPIPIDENDRRFTVVTGGWDENLGKNGHKYGWNYNDLDEELPQFAQYLMNYDIDIDMAMNPYENEAKRQLQEASLDALEAAVKEWLDKHNTGNKSDSVLCQRIVNAINQRGELQYDIKSPRKIKHILTKFGYPSRKDGPGNQLMVYGVSEGPNES